MAPRRVALCVVLAVPLLTAAAARCEKLFRYEGPGGTPSYSNVQPQHSGPVEVRQLSPEALPARIVARFEGGTLYVSNRYFGPAQVIIEAARTENAAPEPSLPLELIVPAGAEVPALRVSAVDGGREVRCEVRLRCTPGDPGARHRPTGVYALPFPKGRAFTVSQGFHGTATHATPGSEYAVDIAMPDGTPVCAAREGVVMDVAGDFFEGGRNAARYGARANYVRVLHDDGTMAVYAHLKLESVRVAPGARVSRGQVIAASGNTGYSSGPHLHFAVERNAGMRLSSVPFSFEEGWGRSAEPATGRTLAH